MGSTAPVWCVQNVSEKLKRETEAKRLTEGRKEEDNGMGWCALCCAASGRE